MQKSFLSWRALCIVGTFVSSHALAQSNWNAWQQMPTVSTPATAIAVAKNDDGRPALFTLGKDGVVYFTTQNPPDIDGSESDDWGGWTRLDPPQGISFASLAVGVNQDARLEAFAGASDLHIWHAWQVTPGGPWTSWAQLPNPPTRNWSIETVSVGSNGDGSLDLFVKNSFDELLYHTAQTTPNGGWSGAWENLGGPDSGQVHEFTTGLNHLNGRQQAFTLVGNNQVWMMEQSAPQGSWGGWLPVPGAATESLSGPVDVQANQDGRPEVIFHSIINFWHTWEVGPSGTWVNAWDNLGAPAGFVDQFSSARLGDGRIAVFAGIVNSGLWERAQTSINSGWGSWVLVNRDFVPLHGITKLAVSTTNYGRSVAFALRNDGQIWRTSESTAPELLAPPPGTKPSPQSILEITDASGSGGFQNPSNVPPGAGIDAGKNGCGNNQWFQFNTYNPAYEWEPMTPGGQIEAAEVGIAGWAFNVHRSIDDVWFTHPFGPDFNYDVVPDAGYSGLIAGRHAADGDQSRSVKIAQSFYGLAASDSLHVEIDGDFVPTSSSYSIQEGDRVALVGRWVVDCGHGDFHTEIHPPLVAVAARNINNTATQAIVYSRPFLVDQEFGDGAMYEHFTLEIAKAALAILPGAYQMQARPRIFGLPFKGNPSVNFVLRPPTPRRFASDQLQLSYSLMARPGVNITFSPASNDGIRVNILMRADQYVPAALPAKASITISKAELEATREDTSLIYNVLQPLGGIVLAADLERGIATDRYQTAQTPTLTPHTLLGTEIFSATVDSNSDLQWPVIGQLGLSWRSSPGALAPVIVSSPPTKALSISAATKWVDTHVSFSRGQRLVVDAAGTWSNSGPPKVGPNGYSNFTFPGTLLANANLASLIGMIDGHMFFVGQHCDKLVNSTGELFLSINDTPDSFADNQGAVAVKIWKSGK